MIRNQKSDSSYDETENLDALTSKIQLQKLANPTIIIFWCDIWPSCLHINHVTPKNTFRDRGPARGAARHPRTAQQQHGAASGNIHKI